MRTLALAALLALGLGATARSLRADDPAPAPPLQNAEVQKWIADLGSDDFRTREEASRRLAEAGDSAKPALEKAAAESESLEVRWRAEQLLRRLAGRGEKPLGSPDADDGGNAVPRPGLQGWPGLGGMDERIRKLIEEMDRRGRELRGSPWPSHFAPFAFGPSRIEAPGLVLETGPSLVGLGTTLHVTRKDAAGNEVTEIFKGRDLAAILAANPDLARHPGMDELKKKVEEARTKANPFASFGVLPGSGSMTITNRSGVQIVQDANGAKVTITETGPDGQEKVTEYRGKDVEEIKREHPELKDKIGTFSFSMRIGPPLVMPDQPFPGGLQPFAPVPVPGDEQLPAPASDGALGVVVGPPERILALHLGLDPERTLLVYSVRAGSPAEAIGLKAYDVIVEIDGRTLDSRAAGVDSLRKAGASKAPLILGIIRSGKRETLSR